MDLFEDVIDKTKNRLPHDGTVNYYGKLFSREEANSYFDTLMNTIDWRNDEAVVFGKKVITKRKVAWYGEKRFEYTYSNITKYALPWTKELLALKRVIENSLSENLKSCLR